MKSGETVIFYSVDDSRKRGEMNNERLGIMKTLQVATTAKHA